MFDAKCMSPCDYGRLELLKTKVKWILLQQFREAWKLWVSCSVGYDRSFQPAKLKIVCPSPSSQ